MPLSVTERFSRTYTPRVPDDSYDSLGPSEIVDSIVRAPFEKPFEEILLQASLANGVLAWSLVPAGQQVRVNISAVFSGGAMQTSGVRGPIEADKFQLTTAMAGGTLQ